MVYIVANAGHIELLQDCDDTSHFWFDNKKFNRNVSRSYKSSIICQRRCV